MENTAARSPDRSAPTTTSPTYTLLVSVSTLLVLVVVLLSAYLRLANSGLGCQPWPECYATITATGAGTPATVIPAWATLVHRLTASLLGLLVLGLAFVALQRRRQPGQSVWLPLAVLGLTVFLALLGYKTPSPLLPWVTLGNLLGGMGMLALLWWLGLRPPAVAVGDRRLRVAAGIGLGLLAAQIALGAWTSANFAAAACPELTRCESQKSAIDVGAAFDPSRRLSLGADGRVIIDDNAKLIHVTHRAGAVAVLFYLGWLALRVRTANAGLRGTGIALLVLLGVQIALGMAMVGLALPVTLALLHNGTAAALLLAVVTLNRRLCPAADAPR